ncbi:MAG: iron-sulfur cluster assembly scaffold protein, partial [Candidatus Korobacteraceae bacterium]
AEAVPLQIALTKPSMYTPQLIDHFEHPRNAGELAEADARVRVENPACGDILELAVKVDGSCIREIRFRAKGCVPAMACGSLITELAKGKDVAEVVALTKETVVQEIGGLPAASGHAAQLAVDAVRAVVAKAIAHE